MNSGMSLFVGVGIGIGAGVSFRGGLNWGVTSGKLVGIRTYTSAEFIPGIGGGVDFSGGTDGVDGGVSSGGGAQLSAEAGLGLNFTLFDGDPFTTCQ